MQTFTYAKKATALRSTVYGLSAVLMADVVTVVVVTLLVPSYWKAVTVVVGVTLMTIVWRGLTRILRTAHTLDGQALTVHFGQVKVVVPRSAIAGASAFHGALPRGVSVPTMPAVYRPETDALYVVADKKGLVAVCLAKPVEAKVAGLGLVQFSSLVLSLDEPERFLGALGERPASGEPGAAGAATTVRSSVATWTAPPVAGEGAAIRLVDLEKRYGDFKAVDGVNLMVAPGEVLAFLGSNGAGKSTTIKMMTGLLRPTAGRVELCGQDLWAGGAAVRQLVGYVPDVPLLYEGLTAREFLWLVAGLYGLPRPDGRERAEELLTLMQLERWGDHLIRSFSLGMKRKMAIAAALMHKPRVLLLDEVTNGLDPRAARDVKDLIKQAAAQGTAIFLTTHLLDVVQELAHRIAIIDRGELRAIGTQDELREQAGLPGATLEELFLALTGAREVVA